MPEPTPPPSPRTTVRREERGAYDEATIHAVLDEAVFCHVGFVVDEQPFVIPTIHCRIADTLYLHGSPATRLMRVLKRGEPVCVTATILDGLVLARSAFHHAVNYRSVVVLGQPWEVTDMSEKRAACDALVDHVVPGRSGATRPPSDKELRATAVAALAIDEASAKIRTGGPNDEPDDLSLPYWAGVLPLGIRTGEPVAEPLVPSGIPAPDHVRGWTR